MTDHVITVRGDIDPELLGFCQPHEHLFTAAGPALRGNPALLIDDEKKTAVDMDMYMRAGGCSVVDAQPVFTGRDACALKRISEKSNVYVIASTGFHNLIYYGENNPFFDLDEEELAAIFTKELVVGMYDGHFYPGDTAKITWTDIRAGQIKTALEKNFSPLHKKLFTAAAKAAKRTGAPVMIHVDRDADPIELFDFLAGLGLGAERQIYCHFDRAVSDLSVHKEIAGAGAFLEYDTIARPKYHTNEVEIPIILEMLNSGFSSRMLMSLDVTGARLKGYGGVPGLDYILRDFIPELNDVGVDEKTIHTIFVDNPAEVFSVT